MREFTFQLGQLALGEFEFVFGVQACLSALAQALACGFQLGVERAMLSARGFQRRFSVGEVLLRMLELFQNCVPLGLEVEQGMAFLGRRAAAQHARKL